MITYLPTITKLENKDPKTYNFFFNQSYGCYGDFNLFDLALPKNKETTSLFFYIHGGGWSAYDKENAAFYNAINYNDGIAYGGMNYRYIGPHVHCEDILDEITLCLKKIKELSEHNGVKINKVAFYGHSAGAHLSMLYAYKRRNECPFEIAFVVSYSGVFDFTDPILYAQKAHLSEYEYWFSLLSGKKLNFGKIHEFNQELLDISPINYVENACPTIIAHGEFDDTFPFELTKQFIDKLSNQKKTFEIIEYANCGHNLEHDLKANERVENLINLYKFKYLI